MKRYSGLIVDVIQLNEDNAVGYMTNSNNINGNMRGNNNHRNNGSSNSSSSSSSSSSSNRGGIVAIRVVSMTDNNQGLVREVACIAERHYDITEAFLLAVGYTHAADDVVLFPIIRSLSPDLKDHSKEKNYTSSATEGSAANFTVFPLPAFVKVANSNSWMFLGFGTVTSPSDSIPVDYLTYLYTYFLMFR